MLRNIRHRNLTKVISSCSNLDFKALVLQYMPNGSLEKWLYSQRYFLDILQRLNIMIDVVCALEYLHYGYSIPLVHCDLKPNNVLLDEDMVAHVCDFGILKFLGEGDSIVHTKTLATLGYIASEYGLEGLISTKCDVYSYGIMLMETFTRTKPTDDMFAGYLNLKLWVSKSLPNVITQVIDANLITPEEGQASAKVRCVSPIMQLALNCRAESPQERMNMQEALATLKKIKHKFLAS
ncbi:receptor kinase-like protein Xa21 [Cornus florida]|uniref:receptor kinase-like protein Xa21 n=1 Tax=Cornus florida TaxID=4283 RepID=UPI0028966666|nr:receptor kinase-like protein Xa21 [Cornus florida]